MPRNLANYWKMEAANVVIVPAIALSFGFPQNGLEAGALGLSIAASAGSLVVGAAYWRGVDRRVRSEDRGASAQALRLADVLELPLLAVSAAAIAATLAGLVMLGWTAALSAATVLTLLAVLEYVNYYRRQLQHFDNAADFRRLLSGKGFRTSHMARDLGAYRLGRTSTLPS